MTAQEIIDYLREHVLRDTAKPYLWPDELMLLYLNDAYTRFCKYTGYYLEDEAFVVHLVAGTYSYSLPEDLFTVAGVRLAGRTSELSDYTRRNLPAPDAAATGEPICFTLNEASDKIRFYPTPDSEVDATVRGTAAYPELAIDDTPQIPKRFHLGLSSWVAHRCQKNDDNDGENTNASTGHGDDFGRFLVESKREVTRKRMGTTPVVRQNWTGKR